MKFAHVDSITGKLLGWYDDEIHQTIPLPKVQVTVEQWETAIKDNHNKINADGSSEIFDFRTQIEIEQDLERNKPKVVSMRQARLALLNANLLDSITNAINNGTDEAMKIEWEYAVELRRDWNSLILLSKSLGLTDANLDALFLSASQL